MNKYLAVFSDGTKLAVMGRDSAEDHANAIDCAREFLSTLGCIVEITQVD